MTGLIRVARRCATAGLLLGAAAPLRAQRAAPMEFTQQGVYVSNFRSVPSSSDVKPDNKLGRRVGDAVRDYLNDLVNKRETKIIAGYDIRDALVRAGYPPDDNFSLEELHQQGRYFRIDEIIIGTVTKQQRGVRIDAQLVLYRDVKQRQPIQSVTANDVDRAAKQVAQRIEDARAQLKYQRRCENALRDDQAQQAVQHAREGIAKYGRGSLVRTCLVRAMLASFAPAQDVLEESQRVLEIDPVSAAGIESAASALDALK